jgi:hypothetical protein
MLAVARRVAPAIEWMHGRAEALPLPDASVDAVVSQFGLSSSTTASPRWARCSACLRPAAGLRWRCATRSSGRPATVRWPRCCTSCSASAWRQRFARRSPIGDAALLAGLARQAEWHTPTCARLRPACVSHRSTRWCRPSAPASGHLGGLLDDAQFARLLHEARRVLAPFAQPGGGVAFEMPALVIVARKG